MRRNVSVFQVMRHASPKDGGSSSVAIASSEAPMARRSWAPRSGSISRSARKNMSTLGTAKIRNGNCHPTHDAKTPATSGPTNWPTALAARWNE